ncbi:hypothetical protein [Streptomyces sp900116325]|uniref:hypothetical protein n=1 Tax=Streptomyces sp. 900116325 TaxID=3154295 RepID=UPI0033A52D41
MDSKAYNVALQQVAVRRSHAVLARTLGVHITVAVKWQRAAAGDWAAHAAGGSNRNLQRPG